MRIASTPIPTRDKKPQENGNQTAELEDLTASYMRGEIDVTDYREQLRGIDARFDLRKVASKLKSWFGK
jgi:hypothetical protein